MKTICMLESVSRADGGIFESESALQRHLVREEQVSVQVVGLEDRFSREDASRWLPIVPQALSLRGPSALGYSDEFTAALDPKADLLYAATLWRYPSWAALRWMQQTGKPMIVAPHGSLDHWALQNSYWCKRIAALLFKDRQLHAASCLRALSIAEADSFRAYGLKNPICVIPNGVDLPDLNESKDEGRESRAWTEEPKNSTLDSRPSIPRTLLFLGRIHPKKGLVNALRAFAAFEARRSTPDNLGWQFVIAGWDQGGHEEELKKLCDELNLSWSDRKRAEPFDSRHSTFDASIIFYGPVFGEEKKQLFRSANAFILPSLSEGLPMAGLEAWAYGLPVIMTPECNLPEGFAAEVAIRIEANLESIAKGLDELFSMSDADRQLMGAKGRNFVKQYFAWKVVARQMSEVYEWVLSGGIAPDCVKK